MSEETKHSSEASAQRYTRRSKKELAQKLVAVEAELQKERRDRTAMEMSLTEAYSQTLRDLVAQQETHAQSRGAPAAGRNHRGLKDKLNLR